MPITLSDEEIVSITSWLSLVYGYPPPEALRRVIAQAPTARRRLFVPDTTHLIVLEPLYLTRLHCLHVHRSSTPGVPLHPGPTVRELESLGLVVASQPHLPEFPDGLWRITDEGADVYGRFAERRST